MRTRTHAHTHGLTPRPARRRGFAAPRQLAATFLPGPTDGSHSGRSAPGWRLTVRWLKVILKCKKVAKSLEGKKNFPNFAGRSLTFKTKSYETARSNNETKRSLNGDRQTRVRPGAKNLETETRSYSKTSRRKIRLQSVYNNAGRERKRHYMGNGLPAFCKTF